MALLYPTAARASSLAHMLKSNPSIRQQAFQSSRTLATQTNPYLKQLSKSQTDIAPPTPTLVYRNVQRGHALGLTGLAGAQASFWAYTAYLTSQATEPLISPLWTLGGLGISAAFVALSNFYLRLRVAELTVVHGAKDKLSVQTHTPFGLISAPTFVDPDQVKAGPHKDSDKERYWTFAAKDKGRLHYIIDTKNGVVDKPVLKALARGHPAFSDCLRNLRSAEFRENWRAWKVKEKAGYSEHERIQQKQ